MKHLIVVVALLLACFPAFAQDSLNVSLAGVLYGSGLDEPVDDVVIQGTYAYVASHGMNVIDISDPALPVAIGRFAPHGMDAGDIFVDGQYAYLAVSFSGPKILDISNPQNPILVGECEISGANEVIVRDNVLFARQRSYGKITFVDISNPTAPVNISEYHLSISPRKMVLHGNYVFLAGGTAGVRVIDISDLTNPLEVAAIDAGGSAICLAISDDYLLVGLTELQIKIYDISDPENPVYRDAVTVPRSPTDMVLDGNYLYVGDHGSDDGYTILDATDPSSPVVVSTRTVAGDVVAVAAQGNTLLVANEDEGLRIVDVSDPSDPVELLTMVAEPEILEGEGDSTYAYMLTYEDELIVADVSDPHAPFELGRCNVPDAYRFTVMDGYAYGAARDSGFYVVDLTDPANPTLIVERPGEYFKIDAEAGYVYLQGSPGNWVTVFDVSDPTIPVTAALWPIHESEFYDVAVSGDLAFLLVPNGLRIYDVSDLANPSYLGRFARWEMYPDFIAASGNIVALGDAQEGIYIVDVSVPSTPYELCMINTGYRITDLEIDGDFLYICRGTTGMKIYDIVDPSRPELVGQYDLVSGFNVRNVCATGSPFVYGTNSQSLLVLDCTAAKREPIDITLAVNEPVIIPQGGSFTYGATLASNLQSTQLVDVWTDAYLPSGYLYRPNWLIQDVEFTPSTVIENPTVTQTIPADAPLGIYTFRVNAGHYPGPRIGKDTFRFQVVPANAPNGSTDWSSWGFDLAGGDGYADVTAATDLPAEFTLSSAWPNPFNERASVQVALPDAGELTVAVYNVNGQQVATLAQGQHTAGTHTFSLDASGLASGVYFVRATLPGETVQVRKVMLVR